MDRILTIVKLIAFGIIAAVFAVAFVGGPEAVKLGLLTTFFFLAAFLGFYSYNRPERIAAKYSSQSRLSAWLSGAAAYNTPEKARFYGFVVGSISLVGGVALLIKLLKG